MGTDDFVRFCSDMFTENCIEREQLGEPRLTREEYILKNMTFLKDAYEQVKTETESCSKEL